MLEIRLLGNFALEYKGRQLKLNAPPRAVSLLAWLLLHPSAQLREQLAAQLWPELPDEATRANLRRHLNHLTHALPLATDRPWLLITRNTVQWNPVADYWLDVSAFERACAENDPAITELYRGDLLTDVFDDWLLYERERLRNLYLVALECLARHALAQYRYAEAGSYARRMLDADPLHEDYIRLLMSIRYAAGDRAGAIADYERFRRELQAELDTEPMPETLALYEAIVRNASLPQLVPISTPAASAATPHQRKPFILPFGGRDREMGQLTEAWQQAQQGHGGLALVSGEAGIGKTRLTAEMSAMVLAQGGRAIRGAATGDSFPYQAIVLALRSALPLLAAIDADPAELSALLPLLPELRQRRPDLAPLPRIELKQERDRLYFALSTCIAAISKPRPLLFILEDLHWAGAATLDFLRFFAARLSNYPLLLLATYREGEVERSHPLHELRRTLGQLPLAQHLALTPLGEAAVDAIVSQVAGLQGEDVAAQLYAEGEGNPLFLSELIADRLEGGAASPAHQGVHTLISERLSRLQPNIRLLAEVAAVAGSSFDAELIREVAGWNVGQSLAALDELLDRNLVRDKGRRGGYDYAFSHHLIQETIYTGIDPGVRTRRHRRTAHVMEELYSTFGDELVATIARHFDLGDDPAAAVSYYLKAARHALTVYADEEALAAISRVLELSDDLHVRFDALSLRESIYHRHGSREEQQADLVVMQALADEFGEVDMQCEVLNRHIEYHRATANPEAEEKLLDELTGWARESGQPRWQALALRQQAHRHYILAHYPAAEASLEQALVIYQQFNDVEGQIECYSLLVECAVLQSDMARANTILNRIKKLSVDNRYLLIKALRAAYHSAAHQGETALARELAQQMIPLCRAINDAVGEAQTLSELGLTYDEPGEAQQRIEYLIAARQLYERLADRAGIATTNFDLGVTYLRIYDYDKAITMIEEAKSFFQTQGDIFMQTIACINLSTTYNHSCGDYRKAISFALEGLPLAETMNGLMYQMFLYSSIGRALFALRDYHAALPAIARTLELRRTAAKQGLATAYPSLCDLGLVALATDNLELAQGCIAEAMSDYENGDETFRARIKDPAFVYWAAACLQRRQGNLALAHNYLAEAENYMQHGLRRAEQDLAWVEGYDWRSRYLDSYYYQGIIAAYERDEWPAYASPPPSVS